MRLGYFIVRLKGRKFYKYIFWFLFDLAITNAFISCKNYTHLRVSSLKCFRVELAKALVGSYCSRKKPSIPRPKRFQRADHYPLRVAKKAHRCHLCQIKYKRRRETVWWCMTCNMFLCHTGTDSDCYYEYHRSTTHNKAYVHLYYLCETELSNNTCKHNLLLKCVYACPCMCVCVYATH